MEKKYKETYDLDIDRYLTKKMNVAAEKEFEQLMSSDLTLAKEVNFRQGLIKAMKWRKQINIAHQEMLKKKVEKPFVVASKSSNQQQGKIVRMGFRRVLAYAASVSVLALIGSSWFANNQFSDQQLAFNNVNSSISLDGNNLKGGDAGTVDPFEKGLAHLNQQNYEQAATFFEAIPPENEIYSQARLYLAYSQFFKKEYNYTIQNAQLVLQKSLNTPEKHKAEWLIIQAKLAKGQTAASIKAEIATIANNNNHIRQRQAKALLKDLNSFWRKLVI